MARAWQTSCYTKGQGLSFTGVGAHHQNGKAKRLIHELQQTTRTMLIHAHQCWPSAITANLWPYALRMANEVLNASPSLKHNDGQTPLTAFTKTDVLLNPKHWHHFGCPIYVLDEALQTAGGIHHKWSKYSHVGIYLGRLPQHMQSMALVLSLTMGLVSPQFHLSFDPSFHTMKESFGASPLPSLWQEKAGFIDPVIPGMTPPCSSQEQCSQQQPSPGVLPPPLRQVQFNLNEEEEPPNPEFEPPQVGKDEPLQAPQPNIGAGNNEAESEEPAPGSIPAQPW